MKPRTIEPSGERDPLLIAEQAATSEEALSVIRHDMRNKLATVRNAVYSMKRRLAGSEASKKDPRIMQFLDTIDSEMVAAEVTLGEGRAGGRLFQMSQPPASALPCIERGAELARGGSSGVRVEMDVAPGQISISPDTLTMVVRALVENAIEASPRGGVVMIHAEPDGPLFRIDVKDEGSGLPASAGDSIFEAFFTTKPGHAGLGLCLANRAARHANGKLSVKAADKGVVASLVLPLVAQESSPPSAPPEI